MVPLAEVCCCARRGSRLPHPTGCLDALPAAPTARLTSVPREVQYQTTSTPTPYSWTKGTVGSVMEE